jgi:hypothetical protein
MILFVTALCAAAALVWSQEPVSFDTFFLDKTLRVDYYQTGDSDELYFSMDQVYEQDTWAGNPRKLIDDMNSGMYYVKLVDRATNRLIYSRGFATLFGEYRTTDDANAGLKRSYHQTLLIPRPRSPFLLVIEGRDSHNLLTPFFVLPLDPGNVNIIRDAPDSRDRVVELLKNGHPHGKVDIVFLAEGYTEKEWEKFKKDARRFTDVIFRAEPFKQYRKRFNVSGVFRASAESGVDEPTKGIFRNTALNASYNALDTPRYLLMDDNKAMRDVASRVPYDYVIILSNIDRYGGGGIYNDYTIFTADDDRSEEILMHEFGHGFANLADEYFGNVAYNEFFPPGREPHEPNITLMMDPENIKWKHLLTPGIPIPTPWGQDEMDSLRAVIGSLREEKKKIEAGVKHQQIDADQGREKLAALDRKISGLREESTKIREHYQTLYKGKVGVFEGGGYSPRGIYRSEVHIGMFYRGSYGPVSEEAIEKIILHLSE